MYPITTMQNTDRRLGSVHAIAEKEEYLVFAFLLYRSCDLWEKPGGEQELRHLRNTHTIQHVWGQPRKFLAGLIYAQDSIVQMFAARWKRCFALTSVGIWSPARCYILQCRSTHMHTHIMHSLRLHAVQLCALKYTAKVLYNTQYYLSPFCRCCCDSACWSSMAAEEEERKGWRWQRRDERQPSLTQLLSHLRALIHLHTYTHTHRDLCRIRQPPVAAFTSWQRLADAGSHSVATRRRGEQKGGEGGRIGERRMM